MARPAREREREREPGALSPGTNLTPFSVHYISDRGLDRIEGPGGMARRDFWDGENMGECPKLLDMPINFHAQFSNKFPIGERNETAKSLTTAIINVNGGQTCVPSQNGSLKETPSIFGQRFGKTKPNADRPARRTVPGVCYKNAPNGMTKHFLKKPSKEIEKRQPSSKGIVHCSATTLTPPPPKCICLIEKA